MHIVPVHNLFISYPESSPNFSCVQFLNPSLGIGAKKKTFSSRLPEPLLVARTGSESGWVGWPVGRRAGWGAHSWGSGSGSRRTPARWADSRVRPPLLLRVPVRGFFAGPFQCNLSGVINTQTNKGERDEGGRERTNQIPSCAERIVRNTDNIVLTVAHLKCRIYSLPFHLWWIALHPFHAHLPPTHSRAAPGHPPHGIYT